MRILFINDYKGVTTVRGGIGQALTLIVPLKIVVFLRHFMNRALQINYFVTLMNVCEMFGKKLTIFIYTIS